MKISYNDLPYKKDLKNLAEAMQYAFHGEPTSDYEIQNKRYWLGQVYINSRLEVAQNIKDTKLFYHEELEASPILLGLLDMYLEACEATEPQQLKEVYEKYQNLQKEYPFEKNQQAYFDAGCSLTESFDHKNHISVAYPIHLYAAYQANGGASDDHRGGLLYPVHELSDEEVLKLYETNQEAFASERVLDVVENILNSQSELE